MNLIESIQNAKRQETLPIIAEVKRLIPKLAAEQGQLADTRDAGQLARLYEGGGAAAISLVAERPNFGGRPELDVPAVLQATSLPLLIKDFILDEWAVDYYADLVRRSADGNLARVALLLIAHKLEDRLPALLDCVRGTGFLALVETRHPADLDYLSGSVQPPRLIGLNNKNIDDLEKGPDLIRLTPPLIAEYRRRANQSLLISESAHSRPADAARSIAMGADAVLVGTAFMLAADPAEAVRQFVHVREGAQ